MGENLPEISQTDLLAFNASHFPTHAAEHRNKTFFGDRSRVAASQQDAEEGAKDNNHYVDDDDDDNDDDDGLGYYPDGEKRTLTDEQIAIFRHSEIQSLLRKRRHLAEGRVFSSKAEAVEEAEAGECEEGEIDDRLDVKKTPEVETKKSKTKKERKAQVAKQKGWFKQNVKPDLRKRTWDMVETGVGGLDYDEEESGGSLTQTVKGVQRRKISYDD